MTARPLVSVITATYNMADYLTETLDSVLGQDHPVVESIVVDDGSTDHTSAVLERYEDDPRVRIVRQANAGQTRAKNRGLEEAKGEYVGFCDADDIWLPHKLSRQLPRFEVDDPPGLVYADTQFMDEHGDDLTTPNTPRYRGHISARLLIDNFIPFPTALAPRRVLEDLGGFDERRSMSIDYDLWLRLSARHWVDYVPEVLARYRIWPGQMSHRTGERLDNAFRVIEEFVQDHPGVVRPFELRRAWAYTFTTRGRWHRSQGRAARAWADYGRALANWPVDARLWRSMLRSALPRT
jgi:glycosyltransferase involved in cell wall biosynthesis